jgi:fructose-1-phosphate kinase PfkB-like protein
MEKLLGLMINVCFTTEDGRAYPTDLFVTGYTVESILGSLHRALTKGTSLVAVDQSPEMVLNSDKYGQMTVSIVRCTALIVLDQQIDSLRDALQYAVHIHRCNNEHLSELIKISDIGFYNSISEKLNMIELAQ